MKTAEEVITQRVYRLEKERAECERERNDMNIKLRQAHFYSREALRTYRIRRNTAVKRMHSIDTELKKLRGS